MEYSYVTLSSEKPRNFREIEKILLKYDLFGGRLVNGTTVSLLHCFALDKPLGHKVAKKLRITHCTNIIVSNISGIVFFHKMMTEKS